MAAGDASNSSGFFRTRMITARCLRYHILPVEWGLFKLSLREQRCLVEKVRGRWIAVRSVLQQRPRPHKVFPKLEHAHEAIAHDAVLFLARVAAWFRRRV